MITAEPVPVQPLSFLSRLSSITAPAEWDQNLLSTDKTSLLQSWRWGEFKKSSGWSPFRLALSDDNGLQTQSIHAQMLFRRINRLPISLAYIPRGPVYAQASVPTGQSEAAFWNAIHLEARKRGAVFLKVEPNITISGHESQTTDPRSPIPDPFTKESVNRKMADLGFQPAGRLQPARTIVLDIDHSEDDLLKAMKPKTRYNIRLSERRGVIVRPATTLEDLRAFYALLQVTGARDEFGIHTFDYYEHLWQLFGREGDNSLLVLLAEHPDRQERSAGPIAGLLALRFGGEAIYMYGASANKGREHMPTYLLQWEAIRWARSQGCAIYDFWGIPDAPADETSESEVSPSNTRSGLRGVYWFKQGFGGREVEYPGAYDYVYNPLLYKLWMRWRGANLG